MNAHVEAGRRDVDNFLSAYPGCHPSITSVGDLVPDYSLPAPKDPMDVDVLARQLADTRENLAARAKGPLAAISVGQLVKIN